MSSLLDWRIQRLENQIHYTFGSMKDLEFKDLKDENVKFNKDIRVYLYRYEPDWWFEKNMDPDKSRYKNGDAAIIIDDSKLGLNLPMVATNSDPTQIREHTRTKLKILKVLKNFLPFFMFI